MQSDDEAQMKALELWKRKHDLPKRTVRQMLCRHRIDISVQPDTGIYRCRCVDCGAIFLRCLGD